MAKINTGGVLAGGLLAGVVTNLIDFVVNVQILGTQWKAGTRALGIDPAKGGATGAIGWIASDFLLGLTMVWLYAAIRPRFGPGPRTAVVAALAAWFVSHVAYHSFVFMGLYPAGLVWASAIGALVSFVAGGLAGGAVYKEA